MCFVLPALVGLEVCELFSLWDIEFHLQMELHSFFPNKTLDKEIEENEIGAWNNTHNLDDKTTFLNNFFNFMNEEQ